MTDKKEDTPKEKTDTKKDSEETVEVPKKFSKLVEEIESMSVLELSELVKVLEDKFGVSAAAPVAVAAAPAAGDGGEAEAETKSAYNIEITNAGDQKIAVIKAVRAITDIGLKDAKDLVDKVPATVKESVPAEEAEEIKKTLEEAGATVELK